MTDALANIHHFDQDLTLFINSFHTEITDKIWMVFSEKTVWFPFYLAAAVYMVWRFGWKRALFAIVSIALTIVACDQLGNLVKDTVCRWRPSYDPYMIRNGLHLVEHNGSFYGFYSAHAANCFGFAVGSLTCMKLYDRRRKYNIYGIIVCFWALMVGLSRIFVGKHFAGDVLVGSLVGIFFGWLFARMGYALSRRFTATLE